MQANWSLVLNVLLLIGVVVAIGRMMKARRQKFNLVNYQPSIGQPVNNIAQDDIIAVRKVVSEPVADDPVIQPALHSASRPSMTPRQQTVSSTSEPVLRAASSFQNEKKQALGCAPGTSLMVFLLAKENRQLAGYELLQTVLAAGLRFGEGHLFHRHQSPNGQGPVLFSLAAATPSGVFDMQNIGAFSVHGLCLFMHTSGNATIDSERFSIMLSTAKQLSEELDTHLLDDKRQALSDISIQHYYDRLHHSETADYEESALA